MQGALPQLRQRYIPPSSPDRDRAIGRNNIVFLATEHASRIGELFWDGADLVMEVVGDDDRRRGLETKRREYPQAGTPEYWIVDPQEARITVLRLDGATYAVRGGFPRGTQATSHLLPGFTLDVSAALSARS